jgi:hypothetical protein
VRRGIESDKKFYMLSSAAAALLSQVHDRG